jgi:hypothetical protein
LRATGWSRGAGPPGSSGPWPSWGSVIWRRRTCGRCRAGRRSAWRWRGRWCWSRTSCLLDEPAANLDVTVRRRFREELGQVMRERARTVILITHDAADAFDLADRVAVMEAGRIVQVGTPEDLTAGPGHPVRRGVHGRRAAAERAVEAVTEGTLVVRTGGHCSLADSPGRGDPGRGAGPRALPPGGRDPGGGPVGQRSRGDQRPQPAAHDRALHDAGGGLVRVRLDGPFPWPPW